MAERADEWIYHPTKGAERMHKRLQGQIEKAQADLHHRKEKDAAAAFDAMLADDLTRLEITNAVTRFHLLRKGSGKSVRQGDVHGLAEELKATLKTVADLEDRLAEQRINLDGTPGIPDIPEIARRGCDAYQALYDLAQLADSMRCAVIAEHGEDTGGPPLSKRLACDPLDDLADAFALPWQRHGGSLIGPGLNDFMHVLRAVHEAETKREDIPERAEKRIRKRLRKGT